MSIDLNINSYNYQELLNLFKLDNTYSKENILKIRNYCSLVKQKTTSDVYNFYVKAYKIIKCIYSLFINNVILNLEDFDNINYYANNIKKIPSFEDYETDKILEDFLKIKSNELVSEFSANNDADKNLNEPNYNLNAKPITNLNDKNNTNYVVNTFPNSLAPGDLNSIKRITLCQNLNLNSCFRNNYYNSSSTDFQYLIPCEIKNVVSMRLASIEIPNAWYLFSSKLKNNCFKITVSDNCKKCTFNIEIPEGNYDNESLQTFLNTTYFCDSNLDNHLKHIRFSINSYNLKTKFEIVNNDTGAHNHNVNLSLFFYEDDNDNMMNTAGWTLGFRLPKYEYVDDFIVSEGLFDGCGDRYIYFMLNDYQYNNNSINIVGFDKSCMEENILAKIPMINGKFSLIIDENNNPLTKTRKYNGPVNIRKIHVKILDKFGNVIDLNNMDFSFTIEFEILYESFNFKDVFA